MNAQIPSVGFPMSAYVDLIWRTIIGFISLYYAPIILIVFVALFLLMLYRLVFGRSLK